MVVGLFPATVSADEGDETPTQTGPQSSKLRTSNGDGTYKIELSVTGDADPTESTVGGVNVIIVYDRSSSMTSNRVDSGNTSPRRADAAEKVVYDFVHNLFGYQKKGADIEMALVTFAVRGDISVEWTNKETDIVGTDEDPTFSRTGELNSARQNYSTNANGTNWQHALEQALDLLGRADLRERRDA